MADIESGYKWWTRYVLVPLLAGGGVIALLAAWTGRTPDSPLGTPAIPTNKELKDPALNKVDSSGRTDDELVRTEVAHFMYAIFSENTDKIVSMVDEPVYFFDRIYLTHDDLRSALNKDIGKSDSKTMESPKLSEILVRKMTDADLKGFPHSREGDYFAFIPGPYASVAKFGSLSFHLRKREQRFLILAMRPHRS